MHDETHQFKNISTWCFSAFFPIYAHVALPKLAEGQVVQDILRIINPEYVSPWHGRNAARSKPAIPPSARPNSNACAREESR